MAYIHMVLLTCNICLDMSGCEATSYLYSLATMAKSIGYRHSILSVYNIFIVYIMYCFVYLIHQRTIYLLFAEVFYIIGGFVVSILYIKKGYQPFGRYPKFHQESLCLLLTEKVKKVRKQRSYQDRWINHRALQLLLQHFLHTLLLIELGMHLRFYLTFLQSCLQ